MKMTIAYVQICLANDAKMHVMEQVAHAVLAITPRVIDAKVHRPDASIQYLGACMCWRWYWSRWRRPSEWADRRSHDDQSLFPRFICHRWCYTVLSGSNLNFVTHYRPPPTRRINKTRTRTRRIENGKYRHDQALLARTA